MNEEKESLLSIATTITIITVRIVIAILNGVSFFSFILSFILKTTTTSTEASRTK